MRIEVDDNTIDMEADFRVWYEDGGFFVTEKNGPGRRKWGPMPWGCVARLISDRAEQLIHDSRRLADELIRKEATTT